MPNTFFFTRFLKDSRVANAVGCQVFSNNSLGGLIEDDE